MHLPLHSPPALVIVGRVSQSYPVPEHRASESFKFEIVALPVKETLDTGGEMGRVHSPATSDVASFSPSEHLLAPQDHDGLPSISSVTSPFFRSFICISNIQLRLIDSRATFLADLVFFSRYGT